MKTRMLPLCLLLSATFASHAEVRYVPHTIDSVDREVMASPSYARAHPDQRWRHEARVAYDAGNFTAALEYLERAARYADKASQALLAEMHWEGQGIAVDRPRAYAWMDLAAERHYKDMLARREFYWNQLTEAERARAIEIGRDLYADFGDDVAKPRLERVLQREHGSKTGTRLGADTFTKVYTGGAPGWVARNRGGQLIPEFYDTKFWRPEKYWAWQDETYEAARKGKVIVRDVREVEHVRTKTLGK